MFVIHIETNPHTRNSLITCKIEQWSNLRWKTAITTTFYFAAEEESVFKRKTIRVNSVQ